MQITLDTNNLTDTDRAVLQLLLGDAPAKAAAPAKTTTATREAVNKLAEAAKAQAAKDKAAAEDKAKAAAEDKAKEAARIEAEEEAAAAALEEEEAGEDLLGEDGPSLDDAVTAATKHVASGNSAKVKTALEAAGAKRVRDLKGEQIAKFIQVLEA